MFTRFIAGNNINSVLNFTKNIKNKKCIINYITENNKNKYNIHQNYINLINKLDNNYEIALKLSSLNFDKILINNIVYNSRLKNIKLIIDAESNENINQYRNIVNELMYSNNYEKVNIIKTYQMYRKDSYDELVNDIKIMKQNHKLLATKLVRGAYWNSEYKNEHLFINKNDTDNNYNNGIKLVNEKNLNYNIIATHNKKSIQLANKLFENKKKYSIAHLMGMNESYMKTLDSNIQTSMYIPFGPYKDCIPYLSRRLYENIDTMKYFFT